ncbi:hypothetical protein JAAARDRAFT_134682 [Jaapia argillacea MUCL 33604]|uniref:Sm domain-containing protein n=1 Tax=Jaapia argillacea MUCL 33604 TaxID=933084 RepID=A0A067PJN0_9AGAM|nr:hypothetical protein JAAARDRAFT_134682 [Jaapia argillacea MUCL 33604]
MPPASITRLKGLLRRLLRVSTIDGRVFLGTFVGTDDSLNVILISTEEFVINQGEGPTGRFVGQVMIPWRLVVAVEAQGSDADSDNDALYT